MLTVDQAQDILIQCRAAALWTPEQIAEMVSLANRATARTPQEEFRRLVEVSTALQTEPVADDDQIDHAEHAYWDQFERDEYEEGCGGGTLIWTWHD